VAIGAKVFEFSAGIDSRGRLLAEESGEPIVPGEGWTPEDLVLAAVARCSLSSLRFYAERTGATVGGSGRAWGRVTAREDGLYAFVELSVEMDVTIEPPPSADDLATLLRRAEDGCFVGKSLRATPTYRWRVNGVEVRPA